MKVCMFVKNNCLRDARVLKEAGTLAGAGHEVKVVAVLDEDTQPLEQRDGFTIVRVPCRPIHVRIFSCIGQTSRQAAWTVRALWKSIASKVKVIRRRKGERGTRLYPVCTEGRCNVSSVDRNASSKSPSRFSMTMSRLGTRVKSIMAWSASPFSMSLSIMEFNYQCWRVARRESASVYHSHDFYTLAVGWLAKKRNRGALIYDAHELIAELAYLRRAERWAYGWLERRLIRQANAVVVPGDARAEYLSKRYGIPSPIVVRNCPRLGGEQPPARSLRENLGVPETVPIVLYTGVYNPDRGLHNLVSSAHLLERGVLVFMGWGALERELRELVKREGLTAKVLFAEPMPPDELVAYTASANVGVVIYQNTSLNNYYASPNKLYEYIQAGLPVVSSDFPSLKEIVEGYGVGRTFDPEEPGSIAKAIDEILSDKRRYEEMRARVREAARVFNWENESVKLLELYQGLRTATA